MWGFMQGGVVAQQWRSNSSLGKTPFFRSCTAMAEQPNQGNIPVLPGMALSESLNGKPAGEPVKRNG
jgi:hypothetical protein